MKLLQALLVLSLVSACKRPADAPKDHNNRPVKRPKIDDVGDILPIEVFKAVAFSDVLSPLSFAFASTNRTLYKMFTESCFEYCVTMPVQNTPMYMKVLNLAIQAVERMTEKNLKGANYARLFCYAGSKETSPIIMESLSHFLNDEEIISSFWTFLKKSEEGYTTWPSIYSIFFPSNFAIIGLFQIAYPWIKLETDKEKVMTYLAVSVSRSIILSSMTLNGNLTNLDVQAENATLIEFLKFIFQHDPQFDEFKKELMQNFSDVLLFFTNTDDLGPSGQFFVEIFGEESPPPNPITDILNWVNDGSDYLYRIMTIGNLARFPFIFTPQRWGDLNPQFQRCNQRFLADITTIISGTNLESTKDWSLTRKIAVASVIPRRRSSSELQSIAKSIWTQTDQSTIEFLGICVMGHKQRSRLFNGLLEQLEKFGPTDNLLDRFTPHMPILTYLRLCSADFPHAFSTIMARLDLELYQYICVKKDEVYTGKMRRLCEGLPVFGALVRTLIVGSPRLSNLIGYFTTALPSLNLL